MNHRPITEKNRNKIIGLCAEFTIDRRQLTRIWVKIMNFGEKHSSSEMLNEKQLKVPKSQKGKRLSI